jgi:hypothetical protein
LGFVPWLYWVNGPAVTSDQAVVQWLMIGAAIVGGVTLRIRAVLLKKKGRAQPATRKNSQEE